MRTIFGTVFAAASVGCLLVGTACAGVWRKYEGNPVLGGESLGTCFDVNVVTNGPAPYTMYFSWRPKKEIALVRSEDAMTWTQTPEICLEANPESGWEDNINRSCTVFKDGVWHMWYTGQAKGGSKIGYATSTDGVHFTRVRRNPVLVPEKDYEKLSTMNPYVRWDEGRKVWRMWYAAGETYEPNVLCYAESPDGLNWRKWEGNPMFGHGPRDSWDRDRVGACEVHPLPDGRWAMFYIGYSDIDTARIGCAISKDGVTAWRRLAQNPIVAPDLCTWDSSACYKPSVVRDERNGRWLLWYNGRNGKPEYVGCAIHDGLDLEEPSQCLPDTKLILSEYVRRFNSKDDELYTNAIPNSAAEDFMLANVPRFACPDKDIERTYYFRWWTYRKHLRRGDGGWRVTEFLPKVPWSGADNTIVCPAGHHFREGRWLRDPQYLADNARFWLSDEKAEHRWRYSSWLFTGTCWLAETSGIDSLPANLLEDAVRYYRKWEKGDERNLWPGSGKGRMGGDGHGGFLSIDNYEGSEFSLGGSGWKPLMNSAMWSEAKSIAAVARRIGRTELANEFEAKAEGVRRKLMEKCWNGDVGFFTTRSYSGVPGAVRELHGYAPWYFGVPVDAAPDWSQLSDPQGFAATYGLSFPERRAKGFKISYEGHECQWNGPSWPFATSIALTALANDLHAKPSAEGRRAFDFLVWQYAAQQKRTRAYSEDWTVLPWIDENLNPDKPDWISRTLLEKRNAAPRERGKDYNHSTFCDLVISGVVGFVPNGEKGFAVDPLADPAWDYFVLENLRYRGHDVSIRYLRGEGLSVEVGGKTVAKRADMGRLEVSLAERTAPEVQSALGPYVERGEIAGVISVLSDGDYNETWDVFGYADVKNRVPMRPNTMFAIFSMSKTVLGAAMMCAIDDGVISLDDRVSRFFPEYANLKLPDGRPPWREVTIRDLTTHMDGIRIERSFFDNRMTLREVAHWYAQGGLSEEPGATFKYGTARFAVAAACLEVATGRRYEEYLDERIFNPLGMRDTTFNPDEEQVSRMAKPYTTKGGPFQPANDMCCKALRFPKGFHMEPGAGTGLYSTAADMIRFSQMLAHHGEYRGRTIISRKTFDMVFSKLQVPVHIEQPYTCGAWLYGDWFGHEGAMRTDQRANLKTGDCRVFFIQTENAAGKAFFDAKASWHRACDAYQKAKVPFSEELVKTHENDVDRTKFYQKSARCR